ncbi:MAG: hypothetical protein HDT14_11625 [Oscillibacter sp.]|nr:hypothetical protein [Oscillibacter sp.]
MYESNYQVLTRICAEKDALGITGKIAVMGFSAGGTLSANCAIYFDAGDPAIPSSGGAFAFCGPPGRFFADPFSNVTHNPFAASKAEFLSSACLLYGEHITSGKAEGLAVCCLQTTSPSGCLNNFVPCILSDF